MRQLSDVNYDASSLYISNQDYKLLSDGMKRYWDIKKNNMDKILLWRFGEWYVIYYEDLTNCSKFIDLAVIPFPGQPQVGFEYVNLEKNIGVLTDKGFKVAVCEQTETREQMDERIKK